MFGQENFESAFLKGNLVEKKQAVMDSASLGNSHIAIKTLDFAISAHDSLAGDDEFIDLVETAVDVLSVGNCVGMESEVSEKLRKIFLSFPDERIKIAVLNSFSSFPASENLLLVNTYFSENMQNNEPMKESILKSILYMGSNGNSMSFNLLFIADVLDVWPSYSDILFNAYVPLVNNSEREILNILTTVPASKKIIILEKMNKNAEISAKIRGEVAENALSSVISNMGENPNRLTDEQIELKLSCLRMIADTKWTRASSLVTSCFDSVRSEYEHERINEDEFARAIVDIASVATPETIQLLSSYLDFLNKSTENNQTPVKAVVLSVINSLGELGDKAAFDYLLYATYLDYPEDVRHAAKVALEKLKW